ncbi:hypothetical protein CHGG_06099 [Chaetomium globosum CBS 148.51]|uniref:Berberine/berberine-like domain-containing protein n=1 Tax=Chaetomium globosum (strain ATCC 6205 / CBS 148.51 / DSM 1962 / NBRC 6347 / NRRL 1970) TaxID=306901 RepID=Q2H5G6_CHAGB|nr:uncharacterized protein CHGG_06099 [Chaetomium globosum CBS 148.51]EAQ89480.1 hypothetical protein CHGG_06099 [Chaetomium globosum CBS 148.51]
MTAVVAPRAAPLFPERLRDADSSMSPALRSHRPMISGSHSPIFGKRPRGRPSPRCEIWFTLTLKNDARILTYTSALHDQLVADLTAFIPGQDFITKCMFQHLPTIAIQNSVAAGGNVMGVKRQQHNGILFHAIAMVMTNEQETFVYHKVKMWVDSVAEFARGIEGGLLEWRYLNYANKIQDPRATYGEENIKGMQGVAAKYDPDQVFQRLCPGGFKVSAIGTPSK